MQTGCEAGWKLPASGTGWLAGNCPRARLAGWGDGGVAQSGAVDARDMGKPPASETDAVDACDMRRARLAVAGDGGVGLAWGGVAGSCP